MYKKVLAAGIASLILMNSFLAFAPVPSQAAPQTDPLSSAIQLDPYNGGFFTMEKPAGWKTVTAGQGTTLGVWSYDPQEPARQTFFFGAVGPFYLSQQQKWIDRQYMNNGGYPVPWIDIPVVSPPTASNFLANWNALTGSRIARGYMSQLPQFPELTIISTQSISSPYSGRATELVRALFKSNGKVVEGLFTTTVIETVPFAHGPGGHQGYAVMFMGVTAPQREFMAIQDTLIQSLASFNLSEQYVQTYIESSRENFGGVLRAGQTLRETSDIITKGWTERQKTYDILSAKRSDAMLGKERLKDPHTNIVYEVPVGWYENYDMNRNKYNNPRLERIADNDYDAWTSPVLRPTY